RERLPPRGHLPGPPRQGLPDRPLLHQARRGRAPARALFLHGPHLQVLLPRPRRVDRPSHDAAEEYRHHRKKAPMVQHSSWAGPNDWALPILESVRTLVTRGQWNLMRTDEDFKSILSSLPNLTEWHGSYSKPKSKS
ncbi:hypothetical protein BN1723_018675, partial [Verticillium longisporum]